ncbi:hypothetical protein KIPB_009164, partial [Kipferlia bialata]|eukprot:g9164.t1
MSPHSTPHHGMPPDMPQSDAPWVSLLPPLRHLGIDPTSTAVPAAVCMCVAMPEEAARACLSPLCSVIACAEPFL